MKFLIAKTCIVVLLINRFANPANSQTPTDRFKAYTQAFFIDKQDTLRYRMLPPLETLPKKYPLVIFLHGAIGPELDNESQLFLGGSFFLRDSIRNNYPAYVLFPRCPKSEIWVNFENQVDINPFRVYNWNFHYNRGPSLAASLLIKLVDSLLSTGYIDPNRVYILGVSQGGMGVLDLMARRPTIFAAGISICGAGDVSKARFFAGKSSLWLFHGKEDDQISADFSKNYFKRLTGLKADVRLSLYDGVNHDSWNNAFREPELMHWLFSKSKTVATSQ